MMENSAMNEELMKHGTEVRAWRRPVPIYVRSKPLPSAHMLEMIRQSVIRECDETLHLTERMQAMQAAGLTKTNEYRWMQLDLYRCQDRLSDAQRAETTAKKLKTGETR